LTDAHDKIIRYTYTLSANGRVPQGDPETIVSNAGAQLPVPQGSRLRSSSAGAVFSAANRWMRSLLLFGRSAIGLKHA